MKNEIRCEQFTYGKYVEQPYASFDIVASSSGISKDDAKLIRKTFEDCLPSSADIETYKTTYASAPISDDRVALVRLARSKAMQIDRDYFLDEHYIILKYETLKDTRTRLWFWLNAIPGPRSFSEFEYLPDYLSLQEAVDVQMQRAIESLAEPSRGYFQESVLSAVYYLLNSQSVSVVVDKISFDDRIWLTALSLLLPTSEAIRMRMFWGAVPSLSWNADLSISSSAPQTFGSRLLNPSAASDNILSLPAMKNGYSSLSWRCIESHDIDLFKELIDTAENTELQGELEKSKTPLDLLFWMASLPKIGLKLAKKGLNYKNATILDLQWLWRNAEDRFASNDVESFLPLLLKETIDDWGKEDFQSLGKILNRSHQIIPNLAESIIDNELIYKFLTRWIRLGVNYSKYDLSLYASLLITLTRQQIERGVELLVLCLHAITRDDAIRLAPMIFDAIPNNSTVSEKQCWALVFSMLNYVENNAELKPCVAVIRKIPFPAEFEVVITFISSLTQEKESSAFTKPSVTIMMRHLYPIV